MLSRRTLGLYFFILAVTVSSYCQGQPEVSIDSLLAQANDPRRLPESVILLLTNQLGNFESPEDRSRIKIRISSAYMKAGIPDSAASYAWSALSLDPTNKVVSAEANRNLGLVAYQKGAMERAGDFFGKALPLYQLFEDRPNQLIAWSHLARIAIRQGNLQDGLQNYHQAMAATIELRDSIEQTSLAMEMAVVFKKLNRFIEAHSYLAQSLEDSKRRADSTLMSNVLMETGRVYEEEGEYLIALEYYGQALRIDRKIGRRFTGYLNSSRDFRRISRLDTADQFADSAEVAAITDGDARELRDCFENRYLIAEQLKDTVRSFAYYKRFIQFKDSVSREEVDNHIRNVRDELILGANEASIRNDELRTKLVEAGMAREKQWNNFLYLLLGSILLLVLVAFGWFNSIKRLERTLLEKDGELSELKASKEKIFTIITHDLQAPVNTFTNLTRTLSERANSIRPNEVADYLSNLNSSSLELTRSLNHLTEWALFQSGTMPFHPEQFNCSQLAIDVADQLRPLSEEKNIEIAFLIPEVQQAYGDRAAINIVLRNLLHNAIRFTPRERTITLFSGRKDDLITLGVKDNGVGILGDKLKKIFDGAVQERALGQKGLGVGLPMCKELVARNGGNIYAESKINSGSTFYFSLPEHAPLG